MRQAKVEPQGSKTRRAHRPAIQTCSERTKDRNSAVFHCPLLAHRRIATECAAREALSKGRNTRGSATPRADFMQGPKSLFNPMRSIGPHCSQKLANIFVLAIRRD